MPGFGYKDVNFIRYGLDSDNRTVVELSWHIKRVLIDPSAPGNPAVLHTFKETIDCMQQRDVVADVE